MNMQSNQLNLISFSYCMPSSALHHFCEGRGREHHDGLVRSDGDALGGIDLRKAEVLHSADSHT